MFDLKVINSVLDQLEEERGIPRSKVIEAIEAALATAYKKEYGKRGQIVRAQFDLNTGTTTFFQIKIVVDPESVIMTEEDREGDDDHRVRYNTEQHILIDDARLIKGDVEVDEELVFPLEEKDDYGRIAAQTAKQVIRQKIREAEKVSVLEEFGQREGDVVHGIVQRIERGTIYVNLGRATGIIPYDEQIPGERFKQNDRIRAYLYSVEEGNRGIFLRLSRSHPKFLEKLFELEVPELLSGAVEIKGVAREPGSRSKIAVLSTDSHIDPVGSLVGQRGVRVSTVMSELGGEKIDVIEYSEDPEDFIEDALSPAKIISVEADEEIRAATVEVSEDQQSLAIGKSGQNVRLAAKLTGWKIDIVSLEGDSIAETDGEEVDIVETSEESVEDPQDEPEASTPEETDEAAPGTEDREEASSDSESEEEEEKKEDK